jgi:hypothetical protein
MQRLTYLMQQLFVFQQNHVTKTLDLLDLIAVCKCTKRRDTVNINNSAQQSSGSINNINLNLAE